MPSFVAKVVIWLQWGRGLSAAEIAADQGRDVPGPSASMGPRPFSRGNASVQTACRQFYYGLQWGRGLSAAEMPVWAEGRSADGRGFNGAAAFQPRKSSESCDVGFML